PFYMLLLLFAVACALAAGRSPRRTSRMLRMPPMPSPIARLMVAALLLGLALAGPAGDMARPAAAEETVSTITVERTGFTVLLADGRRLTGHDLVGMTLVVPIAGRGPTAVRIDAVQRDPRERSGETTLYRLSVT